MGSATVGSSDVDGAADDPGPHLGSLRGMVEPGLDGPEGIVVVADQIGMAHLLAELGQLRDQGVEIVDRLSQHGTSVRPKAVFCKQLQAFVLFFTNGSGAGSAHAGEVLAGLDDGVVAEDAHRFEDGIGTDRGTRADQ